MRVLFLDKSDFCLLYAMLLAYNPGTGFLPHICRSVTQKVMEGAWFACTCEMHRISLNSDERLLLRQANTDFSAKLASGLQRNNCSGSGRCIALTTYQDATRLQQLLQD